MLQTRHTFNSPADLLRALNAEGYMQAQQELMQQVQNSYEVSSAQNPCNQLQAPNFLLSSLACNLLCNAADTHWQSMD